LKVDSDTFLRPQPPVSFTPGGLRTYVARRETTPNLITTAEVCLLCWPCHMELVTGHIGWIEVICGPMFSGKSEELIRRLRRARIARKRVQVFKPALDNRYSTDEIVSHGDQRMESEVVTSAPEILARLSPRTQVIGIDEANFLGAGLVELTAQLADAGRQVIVAGLDTDFMGRPFPPLPDLLCLAESITKTLAICMRCGNPAKHTQRLVESDDLIVVGAAGMYEARCRRCFEPGIPKQDLLDFAKKGTDDIYGLRSAAPFNPGA
jgi:thymidine kinase